MILSFSVRNFRCFAGEAELLLASPAMRTNVPRPGQTWEDMSEPVAAVFGPNASGKTTLLDALWALALVIGLPGAAVICQPSRAVMDLDPETAYEIDFVADGTRYTYNVQVHDWGISSETLWSYPRGFRRLMFARTQSGEGEHIRFRKGESLRGATSEVLRVTKPDMLFLATAHRYGHDMLAPVARSIMAGVGIDHISFRERQDENILRRVLMEMIDSDDTEMKLVTALLRAADLGISRIELRREKIPDRERARIARVLKALEEGDERPLADVPELRDVVVMFHVGDDGREFEVPMRAESSGTITWMTTAWHALNALRQGSVLLVDELDASLHPALTRYVVSLFLNREVNPRGAQLVFTSHDTSLLGNAPAKLLKPESVWFVEKAECGRSSLYSLDQFDNRPGNNSEKRYLAGQFGAVPDIDDSLLMTYVWGGGGASVPGIDVVEKVSGQV